jgi:drug/metabolite transporter (DMT)-like permease
MSSLLGPVLVLVFCLSQALRDVYFGALFQGVDFFAIILLSFLISTALFGALVALRCRADWPILRAHLGWVAAMNVATAVSWSCYFFGLTHIEPAIVNTIHSGMAPLTVIALGLAGTGLAGQRRIDRAFSAEVETGSAQKERQNQRLSSVVRVNLIGTRSRAELAGAAGILVTIAALWFVVLTGRSGDRGGDPQTLLLALALMLVSGCSITLSLLFAKRLNDRGVTATGVTASRYFLLILVAACVELFSTGPSGISGPGDLAFLGLAVTALVVIPLFVLQVGIARSAPATAQIIRALGPVFIFALERFDGRLHYSAPVLLCILAYSALAIWINLAHGWRPRAQRA